MPTPTPTPSLCVLALLCTVSLLPPLAATANVLREPRASCPGPKAGVGVNKTTNRVTINPVSGNNEEHVDINADLAIARWVACARNCTLLCFARSARCNGRFWQWRHAQTSSKSVRCAPAALLLKNGRWRREQATFFYAAV